MVEEDLKTYAEVRENLEAKGSCKFCMIWLLDARFLMRTLLVGYDPSVNCLTSAYHHLTSEHTLTFLKFCFPRIVNILLEQKYVLDMFFDCANNNFHSPGKIGQFERKRIEDSLELSILVVSELIRTDPAEFFDVLIHLFSKNVPYFAGMYIFVWYMITI